MHTRIQYLPIESAVPGMVLGDRVIDNHLRPLFPAGAVLTDENLHQLLAHQVEYVCIATPDARSTQERLDDDARAVQRLDTVFARADRSAPHITALLEQLRIYRSA